MQIQIDGSQGEGGGQIVRSALALSLVTGQSFEIQNIRAGRKKPGLKRQHLTAVHAAATISNAVVGGAKLGSSELSFTPGEVRGGNFRFSIGTAGSATLVLQTVLPPLMLADVPSTVSIEGGTHNEWAPPFDFLHQSYVPLLNRMGPQIEMSLTRHGFFPAGQGQFNTSITPTESLTGFNILERGVLRDASVTALIANLPKYIAEREMQTALRLLRWSAKQGRVYEVDSAGPGNIVLIRLQFDHLCEIVSACGRQGLSAERVAKAAVQEAKPFLESTAAVGQHLADQLLLPLGISAAQGNGGCFTTLPLTEHSRTHIQILKQFLNIEIEVEQVTETGEIKVSLSPAT